VSEDRQPSAPNEHRSHAGAHGKKRNRTFSLNSRKFYEAVCPPENRLWMATRPHWPRPSEGPSISAEDDVAAEEAARDWMHHLEAGRIGG
jgi:hypothetical protein